MLTHLEAAKHVTAGPHRGAGRVPTAGQAASSPLGRPRSHWGAGQGCLAPAYSIAIQRASGTALFVLKGLFVYLRGRATRRKSQRDNLASTASFLKWPQQPGLDQARTRSLGVPASLPYGWQGPSIWVILCCLPRYISREQDWKWRTGVPAWDVASRGLTSPVRPLV